VTGRKGGKEIAKEEQREREPPVYLSHPRILMMAFGIEFVCGMPDECNQNIAIIGTSLISIICVSLVAGRISWRRWKRNPGPDTSIGRLIEYLVSERIFHGHHMHFISLRSML